MNAFLEKLIQRMIAVKSCLCLGVDPDVRKIPASERSFLGAVDAFRLSERTVHQALSHAAVVKLNQGFFARFGPLGLMMLENVIKLIRSIDPNVPIILDFKREDIGKSAANYAEEAVYYGVDAVTGGPYFGYDSCSEFVKAGLFPFVLCHTSNKSAKEFQEISCGSAGTPLFINVALTVQTWRDCDNLNSSDYGLVLGATYPAQLADVCARTDAALLIPGVGDQQGALKETVEAASALHPNMNKYRPFVINSSSGIMFGKHSPGEEAEKLKNEINALLPEDYYENLG